MSSNETTESGARTRRGGPTRGDRSGDDGTPALRPVRCSDPRDDDLTPEECATR
jgi:hypothetical protein